MAANTDSIYLATSDLNLWLKTRAGDTLLMSDVPKIITDRWTYFRDNWEFIRPNYETAVNRYSNPDLLATQIDNFSEFIIDQRNAGVNINPFENRNIQFTFFAIFDSTDLTEIPLTKDEKVIINSEIQRVNAFTKTDFLAIRNKLEEERNRSSDIIGGSDEDYNRIYDRSSVVQQLDRSINTIVDMQQLMNSIKVCTFIMANIFTLDTVSVDPFALAKFNANNPDFEMAEYRSGNLTKLNYGEDLQKFALRTLGDADKWIDVAIANGLKAPYIDEVGEKLFLLSNGNNNQINIAGTDSNGNLNIDKLYINQVLFIQSDAELFSSQRIITNITEVPVSGELVLQLDGDDNLDIYKIGDSAYIRIFKPNTINSNFFIMIPSEEDIPNDTRQEVPWFLQTSGEDEKRAKIDLLMTETGDIQFNSTGDLALSFGVENAIQAIRLKFSVEEGELPRHDDFGLINVAGSKTDDTDTIIKLITDSIVGMIEDDARYDRIETLDVNYVQSTQERLGTGNNVLINLVLRLAGSDNTLPLTFTLNIG